MRVISCVNQKGGVGKTTCCVNIASIFSQMGLKVLVIDIDPQGNLAQYYGCRERKVVGIDAVLQGDASIADVKQSISESLDIVPPGEKLMRLESVQMKPGRGLRLRKALGENNNEYDIAMIDCPPNNGFLVVNAIAAATELFIPVTPDYFGLSGLSQMIKQCRRYEDVLGKFQKLWIVISRFQKRKLSTEAEDKIRHYFGSQVCQQVISERAIVAESPGHGEPINDYAPESDSYQQFNAIAKEMLAGGENEQEK